MSPFHFSRNGKIYATSEETGEVAALTTLINSKYPILGYQEVGIYDQRDDIGTAAISSPNGTKLVLS